MVTKLLFEDSYYSEDQSSYVLTPAQDRILERLLIQNKIKYSGLKKNSAYIIGEATNYKLL